MVIQPDFLFGGDPVRFVCALQAHHLEYQNCFDNFLRLTLMMTFDKFSDARTAFVRGVTDEQNPRWRKI